MPPTQLYHLGRFISSPVELASVMNSFFVTKIKNLQQKLPTQKGDPLETLRKMMKNRKAKLTLKPVHPDEVLKIVTGLLIQEPAELIILM